MGEAKRRKQLDPNFGKVRIDKRRKIKHQVTIKKSDFTSNYIVCIDGWDYDSTLSLKDAQTIASQLESLLEEYPIKKINNQTFMAWILEHGHKTLETNAEVLRISDGEVRKEFL